MSEATEKAIAARELRSQQRNKDDAAAKAKAEADAAKTAKAAGKEAANPAPEAAPEAAAAVEDSGGEA